MGDTAMAESGEREQPVFPPATGSDLSTPSSLHSPFSTTSMPWAMPVGRMSCRSSRRGEAEGRVRVERARGAMCSRTNVEVCSLWK